MAIIEFVSAGDVGYKKTRRRRAKKVAPAKVVSEPALDIAE
jgi:hypothetical protein